MTARATKSQKRVVRAPQTTPATSEDIGLSPIRCSLYMVGFSASGEEPARPDDSFYASFSASVAFKHVEGSMLRVELCSTSTVRDTKQNFEKEFSFDITPGALPILARVLSEAARQFEAQGIRTMVKE